MPNKARKFSIKYQLKFSGTSRGGDDAITMQEKAIDGVMKEFKSTFDKYFRILKVKITKI